MSEIKRAHLIPLGSQKETNKSTKETKKTIRISVVLPESNEHTCPEYNYKDELAAAKKSGKNKDGDRVMNGKFSHGEIDGDDDDDVRRIALQMEQKYGSGVSVNKKKRKGRKDDYADIGMGYDESDSFIDNTDGYDEMIPQNVTTLHGGFYINSGALEFKTDDEANSDFSSSSEDEEVEKTKKKKRVIDSSDETDRENKTEDNNVNHVEKKRKIQTGGNGIQSSMKKKLLQGSNKIYIKKRRLLDPQKKTVKELLREKREDLNMSIPSDLSVEKSENDSDNKKTVSSASVNDVIESVVKASFENTNVSSNDNKSYSATLNGDSSHEINKVEVVKLPENLPSDILDIISTIKTAFLKNTNDGKTVFTPEVNSMILRLERKSKCLGKPSKIKVYEHLAKFSNCKVDSLVRRAKNLILEDDQKKLKTIMSELHVEINKVMPSILENYEKESQRILQKRLQDNADHEENKSVRMPKRRFVWNDLTKKLLKDILMLKKRCLLLEGKTKDALDAQMVAFLKSDIQILWPDGWMSMNALNKIYTTYADPKRLLNNNTNSSPGGAGGGGSGSGGSSQSKSSNLISNSSTSNNSNKPNLTTVKSSTKNLPQSFSNNNLSITPIVGPVVKNDVKLNTPPVSIECKSEQQQQQQIKNLSKKTLPESSSAASTNKEIEGKLKVKSPSELLMKPINKKVVETNLNIVNDDSVIIIDSVVPKNDRVSPVIDKTIQQQQSHKTTTDNSSYQVIDLSDKNESKNNKSVDLTTTKQSSKYVELSKETTISPCNTLKSEQSSRTHINKQHEVSITPSYSQQNLTSSSSSSSSMATSTPKIDKKSGSNTISGCDDIQKVMEDLKVLQKMASPKKSVTDNSPTSSAVSVIAVNKSFAPKSINQQHQQQQQQQSQSQQQQHSQTNSMQRIDYPKSEYNSTSGFQGEFHKQLFSAAFNNISSTSSKSSYNSSVDRYPHISSNSSMIPNEKYYQSSNNNYTQNSNGHKSNTPTSQSGTYSILDDMFVNLFAQYGYPKEASMSKAQQK